MGYTLPPPPDPRNNAQQLIAHKQTIEHALSLQLAILTQNNADMETPLVDAQGFPRADMDVFAVRHARVRVLELRNDLESVVEDVKRALEAVHAAAAAATPTPTEDTVDAENAETGESGMTPFARIDGVAPGSPASSAGLQREDLILSFGPITLSSLSSSSSSSARLAPLATLASSHQDTPLRLKIIRATHPQPLTLSLVPRKWGGRGLIGCHIVPYSAS